MAALLLQARQHLPLSGIELVSKKVKKLVSMAGRFPEGSEFNVLIDSAASEYVFDNWPTPVIFSGFEIGWEIRTGLRLMKMTDLKIILPKMYSASASLWSVKIRLAG